MIIGLLDSKVVEKSWLYCSWYMNRLQVKIHSLRHFVDFSFLPVASIEVDARVDGSVEFVFFGEASYFTSMFFCKATAY